MTIKSLESSSTGIKFYLNQSSSLIKTGFLLLAWIVLAIHIELVGPTMPILAANIQVHYNGMGSVLASRGIGYLVANILGVILQRIVKRHSEGLLLLAFILSAIAIFATPFVTSLMLLCVLFFIHGIGQGFTDLGGTNVLLTLWGEHVAAPLNTVRLGYGIGAILVNLFVRPFLSQKVPSINTIDIQTSNDSNIFIPYFITSGLCVLIAIGYIFFYVRQLKSLQKKKKLQEVDYDVVNTNTENESQSVKKEVLSSNSPRACGQGFCQYNLSISILFIFSAFFAYGNEQTFAKFFFSYLKSDKFNISTGAASWGIILFWLSYSIGRLTAVIMSIFIRIEMCLNIIWFSGLCLAITWLVFVWIIGLTGTSLFILGALTGLVFAPIIPLTFAFFNQKVNVAPGLLAVVLCGAALGIMTFQKIAGFIMDINPNHFPTLLVICILMSIMLHIISIVITYFHQKKKLSNTQTLEINGVSQEEQQLANQLKVEEDR